MALITDPNPFTLSQYAAIFAAAQALAYPNVDDFEISMGHAIERERLDEAARILCCPFKAQPPHWQHGRVLYAAARRQLATVEGFVRILDIGTAKGFSALVLCWALADSGHPGAVDSVDVMPPGARLRRNTLAELDGLKTLYEILAPWPEARVIGFHESTGIDWLQQHPDDRIAIAFVDGKHTADVVQREGALLAKRQRAGDLVIFDDCQMPPVRAAVTRLHEWYRVEYLAAPPRLYGIARRR